MKKEMKKFQAFLLAAAVLLAAVPGTAAAFAAGPGEPAAAVETARKTGGRIQEQKTAEETAVAVETAQDAGEEEISAPAVGAGLALPEAELGKEELEQEDLKEENTPAEEAAIQDASIEDASIEDASIEDASIEDASIGEDSTEEDSTEEDSVEEASTEEDSVEEASIEEDSIEEDSTVKAAEEEPADPAVDGEAADSREQDPDRKPAGQDPSDDRETAEEEAEETAEEITEESVAGSAEETTEGSAAETSEEPAADVSAESSAEGISEAETAEDTSREDSAGTAAPAVTAVTKELEEVRGELDVEHEDNDLLFEQYAEKVFEEAAGGAQSGGAKAGTMRKAKKSTGDRLSGQDRVIYDALKAAAGEIAGGQRESGVVEIPLTDLGIDPDKEYTAEDLGLEYIYREVDGEGDWNPSIGAAVSGLLTFDANLVFQALWTDCPYEMYWQKGGISYPVGLACSMGAHWENGGWVGTVTIKTDPLTFSMRVDSLYRLDENDAYSADREKTGAASAAAAFALSIVSDADAAGLGDYDRLVYYKDRICEEVVYNDDAAADSGNYPDGGPWALIYVFDRDPGTNVVCEGYSEAFQYLCELTDFRSSRISVYSPTGTMTGGTGAGPHKWNIVHMDDGLNYLADVTNSDEGSVGADGKLFLKGVTGSVNGGYVRAWEQYQVQVEEEDGTYTYTYPAGSVGYTYDDETRMLFSEEELTLSAQDYVPGSELPDPTADDIAQIQAVSLFLTDKIGMRVHVALDPDYMDLLSQDDFLTFDCEGRTVTQSMAEAETDDSGRAVFSLELAARQMTDTVDFFMTVNGMPGTHQQYSVRSYADTILADSQYRAGYKSFVCSMLNYGSYTQLYTGYHTERLAAEGLFIETDDPVPYMEDPDLSEYAYSYKLNSKTDGLKLRKAALLLGTDISLRLYYETGEGKTAADYSIYLTDGPEKDLALGYDEDLGLYYADIEHITPLEIGKMFTLHFYAEDGQAADTPVAAITFGALSYYRGELESGRPADDLILLCRALYDFWQWALYVEEAPPI